MFNGLKVLLSDFQQQQKNDHICQGDKSAKYDVLNGLYTIEVNEQMRNKKDKILRINRNSAKIQKKKNYLRGG